MTNHYIREHVIDQDWATFSDTHVKEFGIKAISRSTQLAYGLFDFGKVFTRFALTLYLGEVVYHLVIMHWVMNCMVRSTVRTW